MLRFFIGQSPYICAFLVFFCAFLSRKYIIKRKALREAENTIAYQKNLSALMYMIPVSICIIDNINGKLAYANESLISMLNLSSREEALTKSIFDITSDTQQDGESKTDKFRKVLNSNGALFQEVAFSAADGADIDTYLISCYIDYLGRPCTMCVLTDITFEKKSQRILQNALKHERDEVKFLTGVLTSFSAEIKQSLGTLATLCDSLHALSNTGEVTRLVKRISAAALEIAGTIEDNLIIANIETDAISPTAISPSEEEFELDEILSFALNAASKQIDPDSSVTLLLNTSLELPRYVIGDKRRFALMLKGFLNNCAAYTKNGRIVLSVSLNSEQTNDTQIFINFLIKDTGLSKEREKELTQTDADSRAGSVLSARKLCLAMNGEQSVEIDHSGVLFRFTMPFKYAPNTETTMQAIDTPMLFGLNMLLADSDELSLKIMQRLLKCSRVNCYLARSGEQALDIAAKYRDKGTYFDAVLIDKTINGNDDCIAKIRLSFLNPPKIVLLTSGQGNKISQTAHYIDEIIEKPFVPTRFIQKICGCLGPKTTHEDTPPSYPQYKDALVLICDDNVINQEITARMLNDFGVETIMADNGKEAVDIVLAGQAVDLILMDLYMPIMDGFEATRLIRADSRFHEIPIISLSADTMPQVIVSCIECGMNGHLPKPIEWRALNDLLKRRLPADKRV